MTDITPLVPRQPVPPLAVRLVGGRRFDVTTENSERFTLVVFYRGLHCPICRTQLSDLETKLPDFVKRGVGVVAISSDNAERVERSQREWKLPNLRLGYGLDLRVARAWGLYVSTGHGTTSAGVEEPALFSEPGLFLVGRITRSISPAYRRCRSRGLTSPIFSAPSTTSSPRTTRRAAK